MPVSYDSKKIIPAPIVRVDKQYQTTGDGTKIGSVFNLTVTGTLVAWKGSPLGLTSPGGSSYGGYQNRFWIDSDYPPDETVVANQRLKSLLAKQRALRDLFSNDGLSLEFTPLDGSSPMKCYPKVKGITFNEGIWYDRIDYVITLEADCLLLDGVPICEDEFDEYISAASESWTMEIDTSTPEGIGLPVTYRLSHTISATGKRFFDEGTLSKPAWEQARDYVLPRLGIDSNRIFSSGVMNLPNYYGGLNQVRSETLDEINGTYAVTETWTVASGSALEQFDINTTTSATDGLTTVSINGIVTGLEERNNNNTLITDKYTNAVSKFATVSPSLLSRAQDYSGKTLNATPKSTSIGRSPLGGTITYTYEYDTRPSNCITGSLSQSVNVQDTFGADVFASIFVLGRAAGPVLQDLGAKQQSSRSLGIELVMSGVQPGGCSAADIRTAMTTNKPSNIEPTKTEIETIIAAANPANDPSANANSQVFIQDKTETWDYLTGRYTYNITWVYEL